MELSSVENGSEGASAPAAVPPLKIHEEGEFPEFDTLELQREEFNGLNLYSVEILKTTDLSGRPILLTTLRNFECGTVCGYLTMDPRTCEELGIYDWKDTRLWTSLFLRLRKWNYAKELSPGGQIKVGFTCNYEEDLDAAPWDQYGIPRDKYYAMRMLKLMALMIRTKGFSLHSEALDRGVVQGWLDLAKRVEHECLSDQRRSLEALEWSIDSRKRFSVDTNKATAHLREDHK